MSDNWDEYAQGWENNPDAVLYSEKAFESLCNTVGLEGLTVLDFGCGTGLLTEKMARNASRVLGMDLSAKMIAVLENKQLSNVDTLVVELTEETVKSNTLLQTRFDLIVASSVCAFLSDYEGTLRLLQQLLVPKGLFVQWDWLKAVNDADFGFTAEMVEAAFRNSGLQPMSIDTPFALDGKQGPVRVVMGVAKKA